MTTFSYTTGNPANLTGGSNASMNDIAGPFTDLRTYLNGGNIGAGNIAAAGITPALLDATLLTRWQGVPGGQSPWQFSGGNTAAKVWHHVIFGAGGDQEDTDGGSPGSPLLLPFDPADLAVTGKTTKLRIHGSIMCNATASTIATMTFGLYTITSVGGGSNNLAVTVGAAVAGGTVAVTPPGASALGPNFASADFNAPSAGTYLLGWQPSSTGAVNCKLGGLLSLEVHYV